MFTGGWFIELHTVVQAEEAAQTANTDPWQVAQHEAMLAAGETPADPPADPPAGVQLYKELEMSVEPESQGSAGGSDEQSHMQQ